MMRLISPAAISSPSPTFSSYSGSRPLELIAARVITKMAAAQPQTDDHLFADTSTQDQYYSPQLTGEGNVSHSHDFDFSFFCRTEPETEPITADKLFSNGQIRPLFPIFNSDLVFDQPDGLEPSPGGVPKVSREKVIRLPMRKLITGEKTRTLKAVPEGDYCVWTPASPDLCKKSKSTRRWRLRDLLPRSGSDGNDTLAFLSPAATGRQDKSKPAVKVNKQAKPATTSELERYIRERAMRVGDRRRSYLPYKQDIVGFFASANGLSRPHH